MIDHGERFRPYRAGRCQLRREDDSPERLMEASHREILDGLEAISAADLCSMPRAITRLRYRVLKSRP
jgi:hypothetical protein